MPSLKNKKSPAKKPLAAKPSAKRQPKSAPSQNSDDASPSDDFLLVGADTAISAVEKGMSRAEKFVTHADPGEAPESGDITRMNLGQVGQLHQYYTNLFAYMLGECAVADMRYTAAKSTYTHITKVEKYKLAGGSNAPMWQVDAQLEENPVVKKSYTALLNAEAYKEVLQAKTKGVELKVQMMSREISRRASEREERS